jgi:hypothetical protein
MNKYYIVEKLTVSYRQPWSWRVTGYENGNVLLQTIHKDDVSKNMEVSAWESRGFVHRRP